MTSPPPKKKRGLSPALQTALVRAAYHAASTLAKLFGLPFWYVEQRRSRLLDRLEREGNP